MRIDAYQCDWCNRREINPADGWRELVHARLSSGAEVVEHVCPSCWADVVGLKGRTSVGAWGASDADGAAGALTAVHDRLMQGVRRVYEDHDVLPGEEPNTQWDPEPPEGWENTD